jgi:hypothetical protein
MKLRSHLLSPGARQARRSPPAPRPPHVEQRRSENPDGDSGPALWKLLLEVLRVHWRLVRLALAITAIVACGVALGWHVLDIARAGRTSRDHVVAAAVALVGAVVGWIAADAERAYRRARRFR